MPNNFSRSAVDANALGRATIAAGNCGGAPLVSVGGPGLHHRDRVQADTDAAAITRRPILAALLAGVALIATACGSSRAPITASRSLPKQLVRHITTPELWYTPQLVKPGARPFATNGQPEEPNECSFPFRFWGYQYGTHTYLTSGDLRLHLIKVISYQALSGHTVFETDNFYVLIDHAHPFKDWKVTGRYGEWFLDAKRVWLESGVLSATPNPSGGETVVDPHPGPITTKPDLCKTLSS
jgi:hypothetical protein